jgi:hypothetical protein
MMHAEETNNCLNCGYPLSSDDKYCPRCSQKNTDGRVPVWAFIKDFFENVFNLDSKLFQTFLALFIPGKLTIEYFMGKHKSYANPVRLFLFAGITLFAVVIWKTSDIDFGVDKSAYQKQADIVRLRYVLNEEMDRYRNTYQDTSEYYKTDSLKRWILAELDNGAGDSLALQNIFGNNRLKVSAIDFVELPEDTLLTKYGVTSDFQMYMFRQQIKTMKNGRGLFHFFIGKLPVMIFFMMPFLSFILFLLYIRHRYYFVEHLVFSFHTHTFAFLITMVLVLTGKWLPGGMIAILVISIFIYQFIAQKRYYRQGFFKTLIKFLMLNFLYSFLVSLFFALAVAISFALY